MLLHALPTAELWGMMPPEETPTIEACGSFKIEPCGHFNTANGVFCIPIVKLNFRLSLWFSASTLVLSFSADIFFAPQDSRGARLSKKHTAEIGFEYESQSLTLRFDFWINGLSLRAIDRVTLAESVQDQIHEYILLM